MIGEIEITPDEHIGDVLQIRLNSFEDLRGINYEGFNFETYSRAHPIFLNFQKNPVDSVSISQKKVIRGFHGDSENHKIIQIMHGEAELAFYDTRVNSPYFGKWTKYISEGSFPLQFILPPGVVNAHRVISANCVFFYKLSNGYVPQEKQIHVHWKKCPFWQNLDYKPILSARDL